MENEWIDTGGNSKLRSGPSNLIVGKPQLLCDKEKFHVLLGHQLFAQVPGNVFVAHNFHPKTVVHEKFASPFMYIGLSRNNHRNYK